MNQQAARLLNLIGEDLDQKVFPTVHDGGLVWPARTAVISHASAKEIQDDRQSNAQRTRPTEPSGTRRAAPARAPGSPPTGTPGNAWSPGAAPSLARLVHGLDEPIQALAAAYPGIEAVQAKEALWLRVPASVIPHLGHRAIFAVVLIPALKIARGWAFWDYGIWGLQPIGPRHTNYGDASICAFDDRDGTWVYGDSLVTLLDLYAVWAVRHLHLQQFGRWPGPQASFSPFERLREYGDEEWCGCDNPANRYVDCCKDGDHQMAAQVRGEYLAQALLQRAVPAGVLAFTTSLEPPAITYKGASPHFGGRYEP